MSKVGLGFEVLPYWESATLIADYGWCMYVDRNDDDFVYLQSEMRNTHICIQEVKKSDKTVRVLVNCKLTATQESFKRSDNSC